MEVVARRRLSGLGRGWDRRGRGDQADRVELRVAALRARPFDPRGEFRAAGVGVGREEGGGGDGQLFLALDRQFQGRGDGARVLLDGGARLGAVVVGDGVRREQRGERAHSEAQQRQAGPQALPRTPGAQIGVNLLGRLGLYGLVWDSTGSVVGVGSAGSAGSTGSTGGAGNAGGVGRAGGPGGVGSGVGLGGCAVWHGDLVGSLVRSCALDA